MQNFSSLAGLKMTEKFVVVSGGGFQVATVMGKEFTTYEKASKELTIEKLEKRREILCLKFAKKLPKK